MKCGALTVALATLWFTADCRAEIDWPNLKGAKHIGSLTVKEQQAIGLVETGLKPRFPNGVACPPISSPFGSPTRYDGSFRAQRANNGYHGGMDISLDIGTPLLAAAYGKVINIGEGGRLVGKAIWMQHSPEDTGFKEWTYTKYQHLDRSPNLRVGDKFKAGEVVAVSGLTGTTGGRAFGAAGYPHLHMNVFASPSRKYKIRGHKVKINKRFYIDPVAFYKNELFGANKFNKRKNKTVNVGAKLESGIVIPKKAKRIWPVYCKMK